MAAFACLLAGCFGREKGPPLPDLAEENRELEATTQRLAQIDAAVSGDIARMGELVSNFFERDAALYEKPFPLDTFKHAAVSCLNDPVSDVNEREPELVRASEEMGVKCVSTAIPALAEALSERTPTRRDEALQRLRLVDRVRSLRGRLRRSIRRVPTVARRTRSYLATRRAETRQIELELERKRPEYDADDFDEAMQRLNTYRERLDAVREDVKALEEKTSGWTSSVNEVNDRLYMQLTQLGRL